MDDRVNPGTRLADEANSAAVPDPDATVRQSGRAKPGQAGESGSNGDRADRSSESAPDTAAKDSPPEKPKPASSGSAGMPAGASITTSAASAETSPWDKVKPSSSGPASHVTEGAGALSSAPASPASFMPDSPAAGPAAGIAGASRPGAAAPGPAQPRPAGPAASLGMPATSGLPAAGPATAAQVTDLPSASRPAPPFPALVRPNGLRSRIAAPLRSGNKKKPRPGQTGRPGGPVQTGRTATVQTKAGAQRRPAAQVTPRAVSPDGAQARDAQLVVSRIEPWSVMKFSFMIALVGWVVLFVVVAALFYLFSSLGVFHQIEQTIGLISSTKGSGSNAAKWFSASTVLGYTMLAGAIDVVLITALSTVGAVIYNLVTTLSGGIEITLREAD